MFDFPPDEKGACDPPRGYSSTFWFGLNHREYHHTYTHGRFQSIITCCRVRVQCETSIKPWYEQDHNFSVCASAVIPR